MDLSTMMSKIDLHQYQAVKEFLNDIHQICLNALEYNPDKDQQSKQSCFIFARYIEIFSCYLLLLFKVHTWTQAKDFCV